MKVLDLFAGLCGWSRPFAERGHEVWSVDLAERFDVSSHADILTMTADDVPWQPDIILASPPCETFSVMTIGRNWGPGRIPKTDKARLGIDLVYATRRLIDELRPRYFVIENPRAMLRKIEPLADLERVTVTYCQYGEAWMKPTDLWGGFPPAFTPRPMCRPGASCHVSAPRGSRTGVQGGQVLLSKNGKPYSQYGIVGQEQARYWSHDPRRAEASARAAMIPRELALDVCLAAEQGGEAVPLALWAGETR